MPALTRRVLARRALALAAGAAAIAALAAPATAASAATRSAHSARPGRTGPAITLATGVQLSGGYDAATDASGTSYVGWIGDTGKGRVVHLCTLPRGAERCQGGIASTASGGTSSAEGLRVLIAGGRVTLIWQIATTASESGPEGDEIMTATRQQDGSLSAAAEQATAPSFGTLFDAGVSSQGSIWTVSQPSGATHILQVRPGLSSQPVNVRAPYFVGYARLAFGGNTAVLAVQKAGAVTMPVSYAVNNGRGWSGFRTVAKTWTAAANIGLVHTTSGIRLIASVGNADYWPVISRFTGSSFSRPALTGDRNNCAPSSHDLVADASGRAADVSIECDNLAVTNLTDTQHAAVFRFDGGGTFAGNTPQITTRPSGHGWVVWSIEGKVADKLIIVPVLLADRSVSRSASAGGNRAHVTGPASCLPAEGAAIGAGGAAAKHWHVVSTTLLLNGKAHGRAINGATLTAGKSYTVSGRVVFSNGKNRTTVTAKYTFRVCPNP